MYPSISIVTPSFNSAKYIEECILSVQNQQYTNFEHIIVDGGSTDGTLEILKKYEHLKWISEQDQGQSDALIKGFKKATGDIIGWLNADDVYLKGTFQNVVNTLSDVRVDGVYSNYLFCDEELRPTKEIVTHRPVRWLALFHCYIPSVTFFFKRKLLDNGLTIDTDYYLAMDKEFFAHILFAGFNIQYEDKFFSMFRWHENNKSKESANTNRTRIQEGLKIYNRYSTLPVPVNFITLWSYHILDDIILKPISAFLKKRSLGHIFLRRRARIDKRSKS